MNLHILQIIDEEIARLEQARSVLTASEAPKPRRTMSADARQAIAEAQKRRWERVHSLKKEVASAPAPVRKENAAG